jgi:hypothetical protein
MQAITVLLIHHSGKNAEAGERGSTALRGAADTIIWLRRDSLAPLVLECRKQKDAQPFGAIALKLIQLPLDDGEQSCVVSEFVVSLTLDNTPLKQNERQVLVALQGAGDPGLTSKEWRERAGIPEGTFYNVTKRLTHQGLVVAPAQTGKGARYTLTEAGRKAIALDSNNDS